MDRVKNTKKKPKSLVFTMFKDKEPIAAESAAVGKRVVLMSAL